MTGYELTTRWFAHCDENPEWVDPTVTALFFAIIQRSNELRWKTKFQLPAVDTMQRIGIRSPKTYYPALDKLAKAGFIRVLERSRNQYTACIIELMSEDNAEVKNAEAPTGALGVAEVENTEPLTEAPTEALTEALESAEVKNAVAGERNINNKTKREKDISLGGDSKNDGAALDESEENGSLEAEPSVEEPKTPPQPPRVPAGQRNAGQRTADQLPGSERPGDVTPGDESSVASPARSTTGGKGKARKAEPTQEPTPAKRHYRDNVTLSETEYDTLRQKHGPAFTERCLDKLSSYKLAHGKTYKSDYGAINQWVLIAVTKDDAMTTGPGSNTNTPKSSTTAPMPTHQTKIR